MQDLFGFDRQRLLAASSIKPEHFDEFQRLCITLVHGSAFQFVLTEIYSQPYSDVLIAQLTSVLQQNLLASASLVLDESIMGIPELETHLIELRHTAGVIHILSGSTWFTPARWAELNLRRDTLAHECQAKLVFWLTPEQTRDCAKNAIDLWAWRSGVYGFEETTHGSIQTFLPFDKKLSNQSQINHTRRIGQLRTWLANEPSPPIAIRGKLLDELASLLQDLGQLDESLLIRQNKELPLYDELGDVRSRAIAFGQISELLLMRGQLDKALEIIKQEVLPIFEELGDVRSRAIALGKIADILLARGQFEEALRIRVQEQLPVFERLGDLRSRAITLGRIADIYFGKGQLDTAQQILEKENLPIFEQLEDLRSYALTQGRIARIFHVRGMLDKALSIYENEELPVYEKLGDIRSRAMTQSKIADILQTRGQFDEALRILEKDVLPVFEQLSDVREALLTKVNLAKILIQQDGHCGEKASVLLTQALEAARKMDLPEAQMIEKVIKEHPPTKSRKLANTKHKQ